MTVFQLHQSKTFFHIKLKCFHYVATDFVITIIIVISHIFATK